MAFSNPSLSSSIKGGRQKKKLWFHSSPELLLPTLFHFFFFHATRSSFHSLTILLAQSLDQAIKALDSPFKQWWMFLVFHMFCDIWDSQVLHLISAICFSSSLRHTISKSKSNKTTSPQILLNVILYRSCQHKFSVSDSSDFLPNPHMYHFKIFILFMEQISYAVSYSMWTHNQI